jgi:hypothetical protein
MSAERKSDPELKDRVAAGIYQAITARILYHYAAAHSRAKAYGADLSVHYPEPASILDISERYEELVEEWTPESVSTASSARAFLDLLMVQARDETGPVGRAKDLFHAVNLLTQLTDWINKCELREHFEDRVRIELKEANPT